MYLLDTNVVSELRRPHPHPTVVRWIEEVPADELFLSAVTVGEIQAGIELTREQDVAKAEELEAWLSAVLVSYDVLPMNAATFPGMGAAQASSFRHAVGGRHDRGDGRRTSADDRDPERARF